MKGQELPPPKLSYNIDASASDSQDVEESPPDQSIDSEEIPTTSDLSAESTGDEDREPAAADLAAPTRAGDASDSTDPDDSKDTLQ